MVEWLERLAYGAESRRKALVRGWTSPCDDWKILSVNPAVNGYLFALWKAKAAKGEGWAPPFIGCAQDTVGLSPSCRVLCAGFLKIKVKSDSET